MTIFHLAEPDDWAAARAGGAYTTSTRGRTLAQEGFIHFSDAEQWPVVRRSFYADVAGPLLLLHVDESRLAAPLVREVGNPETGEEFWHLYGPLEVDAVVDQTVLAPPHS